MNVIDISAGGRGGQPRFTLGAFASCPFVTSMSFVGSDRDQSDCDQIPKLFKLFSTYKMLFITVLLNLLGNSVTYDLFDFEVSTSLCIKVSKWNPLIL